MFAYVLNTDFEKIGVVDTYESFIWSDRYREYGDMELTCFPDRKIIEDCKIDYYLQNPESEHLMIIEGLEVDTDSEEGNRYIITGRSLESILDRRVVWKQTTLSGSLQNGVKQLLTDAFISPNVSARKISNFVFKESTDPAITKLTHEAQYTGDNIYAIVKDICAEYDIGFKITLNAKKQFVFEFYKGVDRSYDQSENTYVVFSPNFDNIINSQYAETVKEYKNVSLIGGEGEGEERKYATVGNESGLSRREVFTDARDIKSELEDGSTMSDADYKALLVQKGTKDLTNYPWAKSFEGEVDATRGFVYGVDFFIGDMVQVANEYGMQGPSVVVEMVWSQDDDGYTCYPTFMTKDEIDKEKEDAAT